MYGVFSIRVTGTGYPFKSFRLNAFIRTPTDRQYLSAIKLPIASLTVCRQIYHEARNVFFSANTFDVVEPRPFRLFLQRIDVVSYRSFALRSLHLQICVYDRNDERVWDNTFCEMAEVLTNLQHLHIDLKERSFYYDYWRSSRLTPRIRKSSPFLQGLRELRKLPLKTLEIVVGHSVNSVYIWPADQKQAWVQSMKSAILGTD